MPSAEAPLRLIAPPDGAALLPRDGLALLLDALTFLPKPAEPRRILLAVSGGPDSLALLVLAAENIQALRAAGFSPHVTSVDHGLRPASAAECDFVRDVATRHALPHATLRWTGAKPAANIPAQARQARYRLLADHAREIGAAAILVAHHQDDQIETHRLALARGSGDRGLAGMRPARFLEPGLVLLRPFLQMPGARLKATPAARGLLAVDDPTNRDTRFDRARLRCLPEAEPSERDALLARIARHAAIRDEEDARLARALAALLAKGHLRVDPAGVVGLDAPAFSVFDRRIAHLLLARILQAVAGAEHPPPHAAIERLLDRLCTGSSAGATLGGVAVTGGAFPSLLREYGRVGIAAVEAGARRSISFDGRMILAADERMAFPAGSRIAAFGSLGRGNTAERTLPVLLDGEGAPIAVHPRLQARLPGKPLLCVRDLVRPRLLADLPDLAGV